MAKKTEQTSYPTKPDENGYFFENQEEKEMNCRTRVYDNGNKTKTVTLHDGRNYVARQLKGRDSLAIKKMLKSFKDDEMDFETISMAYAGKIDEQSYPPEYYLDDLSMSDVMFINAANQLLNFQ